MKLTNPTDDELGAAFITEVCGGRIVDKEPAMEAREPVLTGRWLDGKLYVASWSRAAPNVKMWHDWDKARFTRSFDAVLPWMHCQWSCNITHQWTVLFVGWTVRLMTPKDVNKQLTMAQDESLPRAAVIALLRAHGVEIIFT